MASRGRKTVGSKRVRDDAVTFVGFAGETVTTSGRRSIVPYQDGIKVPSLGVMMNRNGNKEFTATLRSAE
jgi:hypothetical protein